MLALELENRAVFADVFFSVVTHPENTFLDKTMNEYRELTKHSHKFFDFKSDSLVNAAAKYLPDWASWYKKVYYGMEQLSVKATDKADAVTKAIDSFIAKVRDIKFKAKVDDADIEKLTDARKKLIGDESKLLEDHRKANKEILTRHFYDMSNMMSRNEGVWLSNGWVKALLWIFLPCFLYTVISVVYFVASYIDK